MAHSLSVGDEVRLTTGWTRMIVLAIYPDGKLIAKYDNKTWPVTSYHFEHPEAASGCQKRHISRFCAWDGTPLNRKHEPMRYRTITPLPIIYGTFLNRTSDGRIVLEMVDGDVVTFHADDVKQDIPATFSAKTGSNYRCHYEVPVGVSILEGDVLVSKNGNIYVVTAINTNNRNPKKAFEGYRLVTAPL